jgi:thymidylate kinase
MIATNLGQVLNVFNPQQPLEGAALEQYYVTRPNSELEPMRIYLERQREPVKVLFTGHRGSGKSTELNKLATLLRNSFFVVHFSITRALNLSDLTYTDLLLAIAMRLFSQATTGEAIGRRKRKVIGDVLLDDVYRWFTQEIVIEKTFEPKADASLVANVNLLLLKLEGKVSAEAVTRRQVRERVEHRLSDLLDKMNQVIAEITKNTGRRVLIIVEDIDKLDLARARDLFLNTAYALTAPKAHIIYSFPVALRYDNDFSQIRTSFAHRFILPNVRVYHRDGTPDAVGQAMLQQVVLSRMDAALIEPPALDLAVTMSGGLLVTLVQLVQNAALRALSAGQATIDLVHIQGAVTEIRHDYQALLEPRHYITLRDYHQRKWLENEDAVREVLHNLSLLEYANDERWCDVHPIVLPLLASEEASRA